jgi:transglutaminase-like putative cysteine protease
MSRRNGTDGSLLASLPYTLGSLAFAIAPHIPYLPIWVTATFVVCVGGRWYIEKRRWRLPPPWLRIALAMLCFLAILFSYEQVSGVGPGSALLAVMGSLKLLETRVRRDQFVLLFIAVFMIMASLLREQHLWSLPYLLACITMTMTAWLRMSQARSVSLGRSLAGSSRLLLYAAPLALAMWVFFPRISAPFWAVPIDTSSGISGLNDSMSPGDVSSLSLSDAVAFRVRFDDEVPPPQDRYWRGLVLHYFDGRTWTGRDPMIDPRARDRIRAMGEPLRYQVTLEPTRQHWVFALDVPVEWNLNQTFMGPDQQLARVHPIDQRVQYNAVSHTRYATDPALSRMAQGWYTRLPDGRNPQTMNLASEMREAAGSDERYIAAVLRKFHDEEFFYTLRPPALGRDPVDRFLFDTRRGFCEHYASAFATMMRAAGIPARIVLGYQGGELNPLGNYMLVRQSDAHAWTEVWLPSRGWHRVDPTAAVAPERILAGMSGARFDSIGAVWGMGSSTAWVYQVVMYWDALNAAWNEWILAYGPENQQLFMEWLGMKDPDWRKMLLTLLVLVALMVIGISIVMLRRNRPPPVDPAARLYKAFTRRAGISPRTGETPFSYAQRLRQSPQFSQQRIDLVTSNYLAARYGMPDDETLRRLESAVSEFCKSA